MRSRISRRQATVALLASGLSARSLASHVPAPRGEVVETIQGVTVRDPYRVLENTADPQVQAWSRATRWTTSPAAIGWSSASRRSRRPVATPSRA
jgi:hypothetical protein